MIRLNTPFQGGTEGARHKSRTHEFTGILTALRPFWDQYLVDPEAHTARGMLGTRRGLAYTADVSFDEVQKYLRMIVKLPLTNPLDAPRVYALLLFQHRSQGLASVTIDPESAALVLVSRSVLPGAETAQEVVPRIVTDVLKILEDEDFKRLTN